MVSGPGIGHGIALSSLKGGGHWDHSAFLGLAELELCLCGQQIPGFVPEIIRYGQNFTVLRA